MAIIFLGNLECFRDMHFSSCFTRSPQKVVLQALFSGVPQNSILSPLIFAICMKSMSKTGWSHRMWNHQYSQLYFSSAYGRKILSTINKLLLHRHHASNLWVLNLCSIQVLEALSYKKAMKTSLDTPESTVRSSIFPACLLFIHCSVWHIDQALLQIFSQSYFAKFFSKASCNNGEIVLRLLLFSFFAPYFSPQVQQPDSADDHQQQSKKDGTVFASLNTLCFPPI